MTKPAQWEFSILNILNKALLSTLQSQEYEKLLQSIKTSFYNRDFLSIFKEPSLLPVYVAEYVPSRALCYYQLFMESEASPILLDILKGKDKNIPPEIVCLGKYNHDSFHYSNINLIL